MAKILLPFIFFAITPILLTICLFYLAYNSFQQNQNFFSSNSKQLVSYAAIPTSEELFEHSIIQADSRVETIHDFLASYNSPLTPFSQNIVDSADKYNLDFRLLPAIAMQESTVCKKIISDSHNCWGWGIYGKKVTKFESFEQAIETISKALSNEYKNKGLETLSEIQSKYNPSNTSDWQSSVAQFMDQLKIPNQTL